MQIACLYKIFNSFDVASATANMFCTAVSVVTELIKNYPRLLIGGSSLSYLVQLPIFLPIDQRLSHCVTSANLPAKGIWVSTLLLGIDLLKLV